MLAARSPLVAGWIADEDSGQCPRKGSGRQIPSILVACVSVALSSGCLSTRGDMHGISNPQSVTNGMALAAATGHAAACPPTGDCQPSDMSNGAPAELRKVSLDRYRIEPPDIVLIGLLNTTPKDPYFVKSLDVLRIIVAGTLQDQPIAGDYQVQPGGFVNLGPSYGNVQIDGLTVAEVREAISRKLQGILNVPEVSVSLMQSSSFQPIAKEAVVAPDGTVSLGVYGNVYITGMTIDEAKQAIESHLSEFFQDPKIAIDVFAYNSKSYYVVVAGAGFGDQVFQRPVVGNETVLDAIATVGGLSQLSSRTIWISRPAPQGTGCDQVIPIDWHAITRNANTASNYQIMPGDRIFVSQNRFYATQGFVSRVLNPVERVFGFTLLGTQTIQNLQRFPGGLFLGF